MKPQNFGNTPRAEIITLNNTNTVIARYAFIDLNYLPIKYSSKIQSSHRLGMLEAQADKCRAVVSFTPRVNRKMQQAFDTPSSISICDMLANIVV